MQSIQFARARLSDVTATAERFSDHSAILPMLEAVLIRVGRLVHVKSGRQRLRAQFGCGGLRGAKRQTPLFWQRLTCMVDKARHEHWLRKRGCHERMTKG
jgi:hypothetical protein